MVYYIIDHDSTNYGSFTVIQRDGTIHKWSQFLGKGGGVRCKWLKVKGGQMGLPKSDQKDMRQFFAFFVSQKWLKRSTLKVDPDCHFDLMNMLLQNITTTFMVT